MACFLLNVPGWHQFSQTSTGMAASEEKGKKGERTMADQAMKAHQEQEMVSLGMAFMGFLMGVGAICGIWFLSGLFQMLSKMLG